VRIFNSAGVRAISDTESHRQPTGRGRVTAGRDGGQNGTKSAGFTGWTGRRRRGGGVSHLMLMLLLPPLLLLLLVLVVVG